jgi:glutathione synthase/RimK-type ligase-like ATP-grasp enzyme
MIAIHNSQDSFSRRWTERARQLDVPFRMVDCLSSRILEDLKGCEALLWHWDLNSSAAILFARQIIRSAERMGLTVFPDYESCWHYDDKIGQKFLLDALDAPRVPTYVFFDRTSALAWIADAQFPKVMKLSAGSGSTAVWLIRNRAEGERRCKRAFGRGFPAMPSYFADSKTKVRHVSSLKQLAEKLRRMPQLLVSLHEERSRGRRERGYLYLQDFVPDNSFDTRITVIGNRAFGFRRMVRPGDFRASGSGDISYDPGGVAREAVAIAFDITRKLGARSLAFDFALDPVRGYVVLEMSYTYVSAAVARCSGYWDDAFLWHEGSVWPEDAILDDVLRTLRAARSTTV